MKLEALLKDVKKFSNEWVHIVNDSNYGKNENGVTLDEELNSCFSNVEFSYIGSSVYGFIKMFEVKTYSGKREQAKGNYTSKFTIEISFYNGIRATNTVTSVEVEV